MAASRTDKTRARERAREKLASKQAEQRAREKANENDLTTFLAHGDELDTAAATRDEAIAAATAAYDAAIGDAQRGQQSCVREMHDRGEKVDDLAEITGWSSAEVRRAVRARTDETPAADTAAADAPETGAPSHGDPVHAESVAVA